MNQLKEHMRQMPPSAQLRFIEDTVKLLRKAVMHPIVGVDKREAIFQAGVALSLFTELQIVLQNRAAVESRMEEIA